MRRGRGGVSQSVFEIFRHVNVRSMFDPCSIDRRSSEGEGRPKFYRAPSDLACQRGMGYCHIGLLASWQKGASLFCLFALHPAACTARVSMFVFFSSSFFFFFHLSPGMFLVGFCLFLCCFCFVRFPQTIPRYCRDPKRQSPLTPPPRYPCHLLDRYVANTEASSAAAAAAAAATSTTTATAAGACGGYHATSPRGTSTTPR